MADKPDEPTPTDKSEEPTPPKSFADVVAESAAHSGAPEPDKRIVEFVGRVYRGDDDSTFLMALIPGDRLIEANVADVVHHDVAFEDSAGRKTLRVRLPEDAPVKMRLRASQLLASPTAPPVNKQDVKPDPIKQQDPIKHDPIKQDPIKQHDPVKHDPVKQIDPIKQPDPKPDPIKQDPGPIEGGAAQQSMLPFVLSTGGIKQQDPVKQDPTTGIIKQPDPHPKADPQPKHDPVKGDPTPKHDPVKGDPTPKHDPVKGDPTPKHDPVKGDPTPKHDPVKGDPTHKHDPVKG